MYHRAKSFRTLFSVLIDIGVLIARFAHKTSFFATAPPSYAIMDDQEHCGRYDEKDDDADDQRRYH